MRSPAPVTNFAGLLTVSLLTLSAAVSPASSERPSAKAIDTTTLHRQFAAKDAVIAGLRQKLARALAENARLKGQTASAPVGAATRVEVVFAGGHDTDPRDGGRPVALVAGALGVPAQVFRDAFSRVHPAPAGEQPDPQQVGRNKAVLLGALGRYGVTNERLDAVSDYYRYVRSRGEHWPMTQATAYALIRGGVVIG